MTSTAPQKNNDESGFIDGKLQSTLCDAPKELLAGFRSVAIQSTLSFIIVIGWILTSEHTQGLITGKNLIFLWGTTVGLSLFGIAVVLVLKNYHERSKMAFDRLAELQGKKGESAEESILGCYRIDWRHFLVTGGVICLLVISSIFHIWNVAFG